jgi:hypothetical protein
MRFNGFPLLLKAFIAVMGFFSLFSCTAQYALNPKLEVKVRDNPFQSKLMSPGKSDELFLILPTVSLKPLTRSKFRPRKEFKARMIYR